MRDAVNYIAFVVGSSARDLSSGGREGSRVNEKLGDVWDHRCKTRPSSCHAVAWWFVSWFVS